MTYAPTSALPTQPGKYHGFNATNYVRFRNTQRVRLGDGPPAVPAGGSGARPNTCQSTPGPAATSTRWPRLDQGDPNQWVGRRPQHTDHTRWRRDPPRERDHAVQVRPGHRNQSESGRCRAVPTNRSEPRIQRHAPGASWGPLSFALPLCSAAWASPSDLGRRTVPVHRVAIRTSPP
jgi:hypothetical protein